MRRKETYLVRHEMEHLVFGLVYLVFESQRNEDLFLYSVDKSSYQ